MAASSSTTHQDKGKGLADTEVPEDVLFLDDHGLDVEEPRFFLLAKVLGTKHLNPKAFTNVMRGLWGPTKGLEITQLERSLFLLQFKSKRDVQAVLRGEPWSFDKRLIVLKQVSGDEQFTEVPMHHCSFWAKIYDVPMTFRNDRHMALIAGRLGTFCSFDERGAVGWGCFVRVRVTLDIDLPLKKVIRSRSSQSENLIFPVKFENLPNYCYGCGLIGHLVRECDIWSGSDSDDEPSYPFGDDLRASPTRPFVSQIIRDHPMPNRPVSRSPVLHNHPNLDVPTQPIDPAIQDTLVQQVVSSLTLENLHPPPTLSVSPPSSTSHPRVSISSPKPYTPSPPSAPVTKHLPLPSPTPPITAPTTPLPPPLSLDTIPTTTDTIPTPTPLPQTPQPFRDITNLPSFSPGVISPNAATKNKTKKTPRKLSISNSANTSLSSPSASSPPLHSPSLNHSPSQAALNSPSSILKKSWRRLPRAALPTTSSSDSGLGSKRQMDLVDVENLSASALSFRVYVATR
ncbi:hypothetical protein Tsubulata_037829 [Turnera subulata]|uniref:CCHC-type domain-containing protein n=1 Tax=Turnera subulata TaxID=218843 RepID=A0A9Q0G7H0_9ROSI|nr:hypothetical protein Tsubulata_037829 [Turnera subulata]